MTSMRWQFSNFPIVTLLLSIYLTGCTAALPPTVELGQRVPVSSAALNPAAGPSPGELRPARSAQDLPGNSSASDQRRRPEAGSTQSNIRFRKQTVTLYEGENSNDGTRVYAASLPQPLRAKPAGSNGSRLEIMTVYGPRWISRSEVSVLSVAPIR